MSHGVYSYPQSSAEDSNASLETTFGDIHACVSLDTRLGSLPFSASAYLIYSGSGEGNETGLSVKARASLGLGALAFIS